MMDILLYAKATVTNTKTGQKSMFLNKLILETFLRENSSMSVTEISGKLEIYPSTIHRMLDTLRY